MSNKKQFGIWMDQHTAVVVGQAESGDLSVIAHVNGEKTPANSNENHFNNEEITLQSKFFNDISSHLANATHVHITGTGQAQEQFMHYLAATAQFKNSVTSESTSNKMSDEKLIEFISTHL
jgi:stalled ribosome rescue protein Dom34